MAHPYSPSDAVITGYLSNELSVISLLSIFGGVCVAIVVLTLAVVSFVQPQLRSVERATVFWFVLSGCIHLFFEGYFALNHVSMGPSQTLFGQLWKEYSLSDSRYLTSDPFVLCMESITALFWGPLSFTVAAFIVTSHPARHPLQLMVSLGQLYGDVLYYATALFDHYFKGVSYCRPEAYYFWGYYVFLNAFWIVIPFLLLWDSFQKMTRFAIGASGGVNQISANGVSITRVNGSAKKLL